MIQVLVQARARRCALETCGEKKMQAPLLGLAKSIYYSVDVVKRNSASCLRENMVCTVTYLPYFYGVKFL